MTAAHDWTQYPGSSQELVGVQEFTTRAGCSKWTMARMAVAEDRPFDMVRVGKRIKAPRTAFELWLKANAK